MNVKLRLLATALSLGSLNACSMLPDLGTDSLTQLSSGIPSTDSLDEVGGGVNVGDIDAIATAAKGLTLSDEEVQTLARQYAESADSEAKVAPAGSKYTARLNKLVGGHRGEDGLTLDFKVYVSPEVNAFALANGSIRVYTGLMDLLNDQELLSVIGHEIGHVKNGHSKSQLQKAYLASAALDAGTNRLGGQVNGAAAGLARAGINQAGEITKEIISAQFSQSDEEEADDYGLQFMQRHGYETAASVSALTKFAELEGSDDDELAFLTASHPDSLDRAERIAAALNASVPAANTTAVAAAPPSPRLAAPDSVQPTARADVQQDDGFAVVSMQPNSGGDRSDAQYQPRAWFIQVAAFEHESQAIEMMDLLRTRGAQAVLRSAQVNGTAYHRVLVGPYGSRDDAKQEFGAVRALGISNGSPFIRAVHR